MEKIKFNPLEIYKSLRKTWKINPKTKIKDKKRKSRQQQKIDMKRSCDD